MNVNITSGTYDFLRKMKLENNHLILLQNSDSTKLLEETDRETLFKEPRKYEVVIGIGDLTQDGFIVMNNIPVTEEGRPMFEHMFKNRAGKVEGQPGFKAIRVLRPLGFETYIILTQWKNENSFNEWKNSQSFTDAHNKKTNHSMAANPQKIFSGESFVTKFHVPVFDEE